MNEHIVANCITGCYECLNCGESIHLNTPKSLSQIMIDARAFQDAHCDCVEPIRHDDILEVRDNDGECD